jgi:hypothetical protein
MMILRPVVRPRRRTDRRDAKNASQIGVVGFGGAGRGDGDGAGG